jgi:hypothetical protein
MHLYISSSSQKNYSKHLLVLIKISTIYVLSLLWTSVHNLCCGLSAHNQLRTGHLSSYFQNSYFSSSFFLLVYGYGLIEIFRANSCATSLYLYRSDLYRFPCLFGLVNLLISKNDSGFLHESIFLCHSPIFL